MLAAAVVTAGVTFLAVLVVMVVTVNIGIVAQISVEQCAHRRISVPVNSCHIETAWDIHIVIFHCKKIPCHLTYGFLFSRIYCSQRITGTIVFPVFYLNKNKIFSISGNQIDFSKSASVIISQNK